MSIRQAISNYIDSLWGGKWESFYREIAEGVADYITSSKRHDYCKAVFRDTFVRRGVLDQTLERIALDQLWAALGASNQTEAVIKLRHMVAAEKAFNLAFDERLRALRHAPQTDLNGCTRVNTRYGEGACYSITYYNRPNDQGRIAILSMAGKNNDGLAFDLNTEVAELAYAERALRTAYDRGKAASAKHFEWPGSNGSAWHDWQ